MWQYLNKPSVAGLNRPIRFVARGVSTAVFPPYGCISCRQKCRGIIYKGTPLPYVPATKPARSVTTPPPTAMIPQSLRYPFASIASSTIFLCLACLALFSCRKMEDIYRKARLFQLLCNRLRIPAFLLHCL